MSGDDRLSAVGRVYADALFHLAEQRGEAEQLLGELEELVRYVGEQPALGDRLLSPLADAAARRAAFERLFRGRASDLFVDALQVLNRRGRLELFVAVADAYRAIYQRSRRVLDVDVESAVPLSDAQRRALSELTLRVTGFTARLREKVEPGHLGGLVVRARDRKFDTTLRGKLDRLRHQLSHRAAREIIQARGPGSQ